MNPNFENLSDTIINGLPGIFYIADSNGKFIRWNRNLEKIIGYGPEELVNMTTLDLVPGRYHARIIKGREEMHQQTQMAGIELTILDKNGNELPYYFTVIPFSYDGEKSAMGIGFDIAERVNAENALKKRSAEIRERVKELNCLYKMSEIVNGKDKSIDEMLRECTLIIPPAYQYPEITSVRLTFRENSCCSAGFRESAWKQEAGIVLNNRAEGKIEIFYSEEKPVEQEGPFLKEERFLINSIADILGTALEKKEASETLKISEAQYRYLFDNNPACIIIWDPETLKVVEVNQQVVELYGYTYEEWIGMSTLDYRIEKDRDRVAAAARRALEGTLTKSKGIWCHVKKNGELIYVDISSYLIDYKGRKAVLALGKDITEQYFAEEELAKTYEDIQRLNAHLNTVREEERAGIAREIHDELGQLLTGLKMYTSFIFKHLPVTDEQTQKKSAEVLKMIDDTIVTVRRISTELRPSVLDDFGLIAALEWQSHEFEKKSGIKCRYSFRFDEKRIGNDTSIGVFRIYQESLTNIMRHSGATQVRAVIKENETGLVLIIKDNGKGFDPDTARQKRTLGLLGMHERARMFGGEITFDVHEGKETTVTVTIPYTV